MKPQKIYILGPEGSGKSTLAKILSKKLKIKHYDLDDVVWIRRYDKKRNYKNWSKKLDSIVKKKKWIIEGIFGGWTESAFKKADLVIMLNLEYHLLIKNLVKRALIGKLTGLEREKTNIKETIKVIKHVKKYRTRDHPKSYIGHKRLIDKYNCNLIEIRNKTQMKEFLESIE